MEGETLSGSGGSANETGSDGEGILTEGWRVLLDEWGIAGGMMERELRRF